MPVSRSRVGHLHLLARDARQRHHELQIRCPAVALRHARRTDRQLRVVVGDRALPVQRGHSARERRIRRRRQPQHHRLVPLVDRVPRHRHRHRLRTVPRPRTSASPPSPPCSPSPTSPFPSPASAYPTVTSWLVLARQRHHERQIRRPAVAPPPRSASRSTAPAPPSSSVIVPVPSSWVTPPVSVAFDGEDSRSTTVSFGSSTVVPPSPSPSPSSNCPPAANVSVPRRHRRVVRPPTSAVPVVASAYPTVTSWLVLPVSVTTNARFAVPLSPSPHARRTDRQHRRPVVVRDRARPVQRRSAPPLKASRSTPTTAAAPPSRSARPQSSPVTVTVTVFELSPAANVSVPRRHRRVVRPRRRRSRRGIRVPHRHLLARDCPPKTPRTPNSPSRCCPPPRSAS